MLVSDGERAAGGSLLLPAARAFVDEAHSAIMEAVAGHIEDGFTIREEYWKGQLESGGKKLIRHQLFRGNEYWFWSATSTPGCEIKLEVYDAAGSSVTLERATTGTVRGVRATPAQTGSHYILVQVSRTSDEQTSKAPVQLIDWALVYRLPLSRVPPGRMATKTLQFENPRFLQSLFANDIGLLKLLQEVVDVKLTTRDGWVRLEGEAEAVHRAEQVFRNLENARRKGVDISPQTFHYVVDSSAGSEEIPSLADLAEVQILAEPSRRPGGSEDRRSVALRGGDAKARSCFRGWPRWDWKNVPRCGQRIAGTQEQKVERIVLARPAVEAGEALGFLPGDLKDKVFPYLRPLYDAITDMAGPAEIERWMEREIIEIAPLAYMRGRTLNRAFIILDEAQNTTCEQMFMFLTRMGEQSRCVVTGDPTQSDLRRGVHSGLKEAMIALRRSGGSRVLPNGTA